MLRTISFLAALVMFVSACSSTPPLEAKSAANGGGVDLSGNWTLRGGDAVQAPRVADGEQPFRIPRRSSPNRVPRQTRADGDSVSIFLEQGRTLRISQTEHGLFISFDRAVVEEYTFGEDRTVSVGPIKAQRVSGWEGSTFVVETLDQDGVLLRESWALGGEGATLVRRIAVSKGEAERLATEQVFDRS